MIFRFSSTQSKMFYTLNCINILGNNLQFIVASISQVRPTKIEAFGILLAFGYLCGTIHATLEYEL